MLESHQTTLVYKNFLSDDLLILRFSRPENWSFRPGQFISLQFDSGVFRAYSIASSPNDSYIELVVKLVENGIGSMALKTASVGDKFGFRGAFGVFTRTTNKATPQIFCATGTGIAPFRSMILDELSQENPRKMVLLYGGRTEQDFAYLEEFLACPIDCCLAVSQPLNFSDFQVKTKRAHAVIDGRITDFLDKDLCGKEADYYVCGNGDMVASVQKILRAVDVPENRIHMERFK